MRWSLACAAAVSLFVWSYSMFYIPGKGFSFLATFGDKLQDRFIPELRNMDIFVLQESHGYDGSTYAQIAIRPHLDDPEIASAVDNLPYRARRILFSWTAWLAGAGDPGKVLLAFTLQNGVAWLLLAVLLFRWLPPHSFQNFARWFGILFSFGLCFSIRGSLLDGPSLLLIACGIALAEAGRPWLSAIVLGVSGLGKETNIGAAVAMTLPSRFTFRDWWPVVARGFLVALPLVLWTAWLWLQIGRGDSIGQRNFDPPLAAYIGKWRAVVGELTEGRTVVGVPNLLVLVSLSVQFLFFALRPRWRDRWWRLGAVMSLLMTVLGEAVWEGHPSAAARVLLPMLLAFNLTVQRGWRWGAVLLLGNISILGSPPLLKPAPKEDYRIAGPAALQETEDGGKVKLSFEPGWYAMERSRFEYWRWSSGSAGLVFTNPHDFGIIAEIAFDLRSREPLETTLTADGLPLWSGTVTNDQLGVSLEVTLPPGESRWWFETTMPAFPTGGAGERVIALSVRNFKMKLKRRIGALSTE